MEKVYFENMIRVLSLVIISICFTALKIYADCGLPTGGACSFEELKQKQQENSVSENEDYIRKFNEKYFDAQGNETQKDLHEQVNLDLLRKLNLQRD